LAGDFAYISVLWLLLGVALSLRWSVVALCFALALIGTSGFRLLIPAISYLCRYVFGVSALALALLTVLFFVARSISSVLVGKLCEVYGRLNVVVFIAFSLFALVSLLFAFAGSIHLVLVLRFVQGLLSGFAWVTVQLLLGLSVPKEFRGRVFAIYFMLGSLGFSLGNYLYSVLSSFSLLWICFVAFCMYCVCAILSLLLPSRATITGIPSANVLRGLSSVLRVLRFGFPLFTLLFVVRLYFSIVGGELGYVYLCEFTGLSMGVVARFLAIVSLISLAVSYGIAWLGDRFSDLLALYLCSLLLVAGSLLLAVSNVSLVFLGFLLLSSSLRSLTPLSRKFATTYFRSRGVAIGLVNSVTNLGAALGAVSAGYLYDVLGLVTISIRFLSTSTDLCIFTLVLALFVSTLVLFSCLLLHMWRFRLKSSKY